MPIVEINSNPPGDISLIPKMLTSVRDAGASALKTPRDNVWVTFNSLQYYLNGSNRGDTDPRPFVIVKAQAGRSLSEKTAFVEAVTSEIAKGLSISPKKVWIQYEEMNPKDVWFDEHWAG